MQRKGREEGEEEQEREREKGRDGTGGGQGLDTKSFLSPQMLKYRLKILSKLKNISLL